MDKTQNKNLSSLLLIHCNLLFVNIYKIYLVLNTVMVMFCNDVHVYMISVKYCILFN